MPLQLPEVPELAAGQQDGANHPTSNPVSLHPKVLTISVLLHCLQT